MAILADDDVIVHGNSERLRDRLDLLRHLDIRPRWRRIAGRMIVQRPTQFNMMLSLQCFFDALTELVPVIGIGFSDRP